MEFSIHEVAELTGITTRMLRYYDAIGVLKPSSKSYHGSRQYDEPALIRLQQILLFRDLGLDLSTIQQVLDRQTDERKALRSHVNMLHQEKERLTRQIAAVERTLLSLEKGEHIMTDTMFDGFDNHAQYQEEVERRWGKEAYERSDSWWNTMNDTDKSQWKSKLAQLNADWEHAAHDSTVTPQSDTAQLLAERHVDWLRGIPGTPANDPDGDVYGYVKGLAAMYVADKRFAHNYGGLAGATFVRDTLLIWVKQHQQ
ncbi:MAG: MerR family transcriptional regulator [Bifidobacterium sp.]